MVLGWILSILGILVLIGAVLNLDLLLSNRKLGFFTQILGGRNEGRIFYFFLGLVLTVTGILILVRIVPV